MSSTSSERSEPAGPGGGGVSSEDLEAIVASLGLDAEEMTERLAFLGLTAEEAADLAEVRALLAPRLDEVVDGFYAHLFRFERLEPFLEDAATLARLRRTQREYLRGLGDFTAPGEAFARRLRIGLRHAEIGLSYRWYLGSFSKLFELIAPIVQDAEEERTRARLTALQKALTLDGILGVEAYSLAMSRRLERAHAELERVARLDPLTNIFNRRHLMAVLGGEFERSRRFRHPIAVLMIDVDRFKSLNDRHGHLFGDLVLKAIAGAIAGSIRGVDVCGRYGGDEFLVGLIECDVEEGLAIAERIRQRVAETEFCWEGATEHGSVSIGMASSDEKTGSLEELLARADEAVYRIKGSGRNQTGLHSRP